MQNEKRRHLRDSRFEPLEARVVLDGGPFISELMASNNSILSDEDGDFSDWIELHNPSLSSINLNGWYLTDDQNDLTKWQIPKLTVDPLGFHVVFASNKDRAQPNTILHTNFKLSSRGEYLALVRPDGTTIAHEFSSAFPEQPVDISYGALSAAKTTKLISESAPAAALVPTNDALGTMWTQMEYDDAAWTTGTSGVGYDLTGAPADTIGLDLESQMAGVNASAYVRIPFEINDSDQLLADQVTLAVKYDDGFVAHLNGNQILSRNAPGGGESPGSGLVAYYPFDHNLADKAGDFANNVGIAENRLTGVEGTPQFVPGQVGSAVVLNTSNGHSRLTAENHPDLDLGGEFTVEAWIYPHQLDGWSRLVMEWDGSGKNSIHFALRNGTELSAFHVDENRKQTNVVSSLGTVGIGDDIGWQHVAVVGDGSDLRLYHNGVDVSAGPRGNAEEIPTGTPYSGTTWPLAAGLGIGDSANRPSHANKYHGLIDEVAMWNVALSADQISSHFEAANAGYGLLPIDGENSVKWNSSAVSERPENDDGSIDFESFDITNQTDLLQVGKNVLAFHGLNASADNDDFLIAAELDANSFLLESDQFGFFDEPTPGMANGQSFVGLLGEVEFNLERGFYEAPFELRIGSKIPDVEIRYTLDGSLPTEQNGSRYTDPLNISTTTTVRAVASKDGFRPSDPVTHTYVFVKDVLSQPNVAPRGAHWDTRMDPDIVNNSNQTYSVSEGLVSLPAISIVMDDADLFGSRGIYPNATQRGTAWEKPGSVEFFFPDEYEGYRLEKGFAIHAGIKINGGASRNAHNPKHSFRLNFRSAYGTSKLEYPVFENSAVDRFDTLLIRTGHNQGWFTGHASSQYLRERYAAEVQLALGQPASHIRPVHLYLNGLYWGLFGLQERPDDAYAEEYFGGNSEAYDVIKGAISPSETRARLSQGHRDAWETMFDIANRDMTDPDNYAAIQQYLDVDNLIDYTISNQITGEQDAPT